MIVDPISVDVNALPQGLLATFKRHEAISHCDDDKLILDLLQDAIGEFQRRMEITLYASQLTIEAEAIDFCNGGLRLPISPVTLVSLVDGATPPNDIAGSYRLVSRGLHGVRIYHLLGASAYVLATVTSGYSPISLPPDIRQVLMKMTGHLYENREIYSGTPASVPDAWANEIMAGFWMPRV